MDLVTSGVFPDSNNLEVGVVDTVPDGGDTDDMNMDCN